MHRRAFLGVAGAAALAGCSTFGGGESEPANHRVWVSNAHDQSHEVTVTLTRDGETLVDETRAVGPDTEWDIGRFTEHGAYTLTVRALGEERRESYDLPMAFEEDDSAPYESYAETTITADGGLRVEVYRTTG